jgi:UPF0755 protein
MLLRIVKTALSLALILVFGVILWVGVEFYRPLRLADGKAVVEVAKGMGARAVARVLTERGLIRSPIPFIASYRLFFHPRRIKAGEYEIAPPMREKDVLDMLVKGRVMLHSVTIPEGLTAGEVLPLVSPILGDGEAAFDSALRDTRPIAALDDRAADLEGYLFPETYAFPRGVPASEVIAAMVGEFESVFGEAWRSRARELRLTVRQTVILASLIEKETSVPEERALVSAVFHNRLRIGMKLDCDPTIIYALKLKGTYAGRLTRKDLSLASPYNTYLYGGLPPGPICSPGRDALQAALQPAPEPYLYFVAKNDGSHFFSRTLTEHAAAVRRYQKARQ